ncbi:MAG: FAD-dependent oxidoreductase [Deltaproteobacteria bacterium]|nr:FAD-dependent oxidoreductase [Deltaproteobacteria bacterium]
MSSEPDDPGAPAGDLPRLRAGVGQVERSDVVILGASFAGVEVLLQLQRRVSRPLKITVVDRQRSHGYIPLVHERLCGRLPPEDSELPTARFVDSLPGARFVHDEVVTLDPDGRVVQLASGRRLKARFLVVALGSALAPPAAVTGGEHLLAHKEGAQLDEAAQRLATLLSSEQGEPRVVVAGGGISGVELAGELVHLRRERPTG